MFCSTFPLVSSFLPVTSRLRGSGPVRSFTSDSSFSFQPPLLLLLAPVSFVWAAEKVRGQILILSLRLDS